MPQADQILCDRYQLCQRLGHHSLQPHPGRQTWLAIDLQSDGQTQVVVKLLAFSPQMQWDEFKLFEREIQILKSLDHPCIPHYRDDFSFDQEPGLSWFGLVQEYIPGTSLQQMLDQGHCFSVSQVCQIATEALHILQDLHQRNPAVLHRDLKPSNLILHPSSQLYLVDFGAVQEPAIAIGGTFTVVGTYGYTPIEQFGGRAVAASDLYALGATLIHLLTGIAPADLPQYGLQIQFREYLEISPTATPDVSLELIQWLETLTAPALEMRFKTAAQALSALTACLEAPASSVRSSEAVEVLPTNLERSLTVSSKASIAPVVKFSVATALRSGVKLSLIPVLLTLPFWLALLTVPPLAARPVMLQPLQPLIALTPFLLFFYAFLMAGSGIFSLLSEEAIALLKPLIKRQQRVDQSGLAKALGPKSQS